MFCLKIQVKCSFPLHANDTNIDMVAVEDLKSKVWAPVLLNQLVCLLNMTSVKH